MYRNLNAECARVGISKRRLAKEVLKIAPSTFWRKTKLRNGFRINEAIDIKRFLKTDMSIEDLFEFDDCDELDESEA